MTWDIRKLCYYIEEKQKILDDINVKITPGQWITFFGNNGSGKSTLLKLMAGLYTPGSGEIYYHNRNLANWESSQFHQKVAWLGQHVTNQVITTSVEEEIAFGLENIGLSALEIQRKIEETLLEWDLQSYRETPPYLLSGGQLQKLALASILVMQPETVLLDEPFLFVDKQLEINIVNRLKLFQQQGRTIITATPNVMELTYSDYIFVIQEGQIRLCGKPEELLINADFWSVTGVEPPILWSIAMDLFNLGKLPAGFIYLTEDELMQAYVRSVRKH